MPTLLRSFLCSRASRHAKRRQDDKTETTYDGAGTGPAAKTKAQAEGDGNPETSMTDIYFSLSHSEISMTEHGDETLGPLTTERIMELLKDLWSDDECVIVMALTEIAKIGFRDASSRENEVKIRLLGGHTAVFQVLQKYVGCLEIQEQGMCALGNLSQLMQTKKLLGDIGCVEVILARMEKYPDCERVQRYGCSTVRDLVSGMKDNAERVEKYGGIALVIAAMKAHASSVRVQDRGCMALSNMSEWEEYRPLIVETGGASAIASVMEKHRDHPQLRAHACNAMERLAKKSC